jgi:hypothetical protein
MMMRPTRRWAAWRCRPSPSLTNDCLPSRDQFRAVSGDLTRFVKDKIKDPERALRDMKSIRNDAAPPPEQVTAADLLRQPGPPRNANAEFAGADAARPLQRYSHPEAASPAPHVSTKDPADFPYRAAGTGEPVTPPRRAPGAHQGGGAR